MKSLGETIRTGKWVALLVTAALMVAVMAPARASAAIAFSDIGSSSNADAIVRLASLGIITGYNGGATFRPDSSITRAEFAAMIVRSLGLEAEAKGISAKPAFPDVGANYKWAYGYITLASQRAIVQGDSDGRFRPADSVTVAEAITMIVRALGRQPLISKDAKWPDGHIALAQLLGIGNVTPNKANKATRGEIAGYLDAAFRQQIVKIASDGTVATTGDSFLSLQKAARYQGKVQSVTAGSPVCINFAAGTVSPGGGSYTVELAAGATLHNVTNLTDLTDKYIEVMVRDGKAFFVAPSYVTIGDVRTVSQPAITLTSGVTCTVGGDPLFLVDGWVVGTMKDAWQYIGSGTTLRIRYDSTGTKLLSVESIVDVSGSLYWDGTKYYLYDDTGALIVVPGDPASLLADNTIYLMNGRGYSEQFMRADVADPDTVVFATLYMSPTTGKADTLSISVFDSEATYAQPLLSVGGNSITVPAAGDNGQSTATYALADDAGIWYRGAWEELSALVPGDCVSFRTDKDGLVTYINASPDVTPPALLESNWVTNENDKFFVFVDEALDPSSVSLTVDGGSYARLETDIEQTPADSNSFFLYYREDLTFADGRQLICVYPQGGFADGVHEIRLQGRDYAGNQLTGTATFLIDTAPAAAKLSSVSADGKTVKIQFDDVMDVRTVEDAAKWVHSGGPGLVKSVAYDETTDVATLTIGSAQSGATITATLTDAAGNTVAVSVTLP